MEGYHGEYGPYDSAEDEDSSAQPLLDATLFPKIESPEKRNLAALQAQADSLLEGYPHVALPL